MPLGQLTPENIFQLMRRRCRTRYLRRVPGYQLPQNLPGQERRLADTMTGTNRNMVIRDN